MFTSTSLELNFIPSLRREAFWDFKTIPKLTKVPLICDYLSELVSIEFILVTSYKGEGGGGEGEGGGGGARLGCLSLFQGTRFVYERANASLWPQSTIRDILGNRAKPKIHVQCN